MAKIKFGTTLQICCYLAKSE